MAFTASPTRTVTVNPGGTTPFTAGSFWKLDDPKKPKGIKDPDATIDITFDWGPWLLDAGGDTIADCVFITEGGLVDVGSQTRDDNKAATVFVSAGLAGTASVTCRVTTASSPARVVDRTVYLTIEPQ